MRKGMTEDEMVGWHHQINGHVSGWTPGLGDGQGGLACCSSMGRKELDTTKRLNLTEYLFTCFVSASCPDVFSYAMLRITDELKFQLL